MNLTRLLHRINLRHAPPSQASYLVWRCDTCEKIADADAGWPGCYTPYNWRDPQ